MIENKQRQTERMKTSKRRKEKMNKEPKQMGARRESHATRGIQPDDIR